MNNIEKTINLLREVSTNLYNLELSKTYELGNYAKEYVNEVRKNIDEVLPEIEDLSVDEIVELAKYSMTELGLGGDIDVDAEVDAAVEKVNDAIAMGKSLLKMVNSIG